MRDKIRRAIASLNYGNRSNSKSDIKRGGWAETISSEENLWFKAVRDAERGDYIKAALTYVYDTLRNQDYPSRAAISYFNAAACFVQGGLIVQANKAYRKAGELFMSHADEMFSRFPRETVWASNRAYLSFYLAGDMEKAEEAVQQSVIVQRTLRGPIGELEINALKIEFERAVSLQKKFEVAVSPTLCLSRVELVREEYKEKTRLRGEEALTVTRGLLGTIQENLKRLSSKFKVSLSTLVERMSE